MRFDYEIFIKKILEVDRRWKNKFSKTLWGEESDRISIKIVWDTWDHPSSIPGLGFSLTILFDLRSLFRIGTRGSWDRTEALFGFYNIQGKWWEHKTFIDNFRNIFKSLQLKNYEQIFHKWTKGKLTLINVT